MNRRELIEMAVVLTSRPRLYSNITYWWPLIDARIGRVLRSAENQETTELTPTANLFSVPDDYAAVESLEYAGIPLTSLDRHGIAKWAQSGGDPLRYNISNRTIDVRPFGVGTYTLRYWTRPVLADDAATNAVSEAWPDVYIDAIILQIRRFEQNRDAIELARNEFATTVREVNKDAKRATGDKPAMRTV